ncbi:MAG: tetratricopeptide repeat protein, partial [Deltaproteobacteria bacterium]|nr:tetratricopeptide repeat protein [Deltaproteobacteria bacterium]
AYHGIGNLDQAIRQTEKALKIDPDNPETHFTLGLYYDRKGWSDMAVAEYRETQFLDPDYIMGRVKGIEEKTKRQQKE